MIRSELKNKIRNISDFPSKGVIFRDITPILANPNDFSRVVDWYCEQIEMLFPVSKIVAIESRGFIFGSAISYKMNIGLIPIRKKGKLPYKTESMDYELEYGKDTIEIHVDALEEGEEVVVLDDLLATGGTAGAAIELLHKVEVKPKGVLFLIELLKLQGRNKMNNIDTENIISLIQY